MTTLPSGPEPARPAADAPGTATMEAGADTAAAITTDTMDTDTAGAQSLRAACQGLPPLSARLAPWMQELLGDPHAVTDLLEEHGSPLNVHDFSALADNAGELTAVARTHGVDLRVFVARKANKTLGLIEAAHRAGLGLDLGSHRELEQALDAGFPAHDIVVTAAIKPRPLLRLALDAGTTLVLDNLDEAAAAREEIAATSSTSRRKSTAETTGADGKESTAARAIALRLAPTPAGPVGPTRFGESAQTWQRWAASLDLAEEGMRIEGLHFHLHGYDPLARAQALREAIELLDALRAAGHHPHFIDIGGGIPMSYLDDAEEWERFWQAHEEQGEDPATSLTWRAERLRQVYPYHQQVVRGQWLEAVLAAPAPPGASIAEALRSRGVELRCEPGRSMLDGCGMTLARVIQRNTTSDGIPLVGLEMNRTQCRSTSDDFLVDPLLVRAGGPPSAPMDAFLVGAYCIEAELILRRRLRFPGGVAIGDVIALPNTAGYLMHILESASHQIPLASNVVRGADGFTRDRIDAVPPQRPWTTPAG